VTLLHSTEIRFLIDLQAKDKLIAGISKKIASVPAEIEALNALFNEKKSSKNMARETLLKLQAEKKAKEIAIAEKDEEIKKHQRELNMVKDNDAFKALLSEITRAKKEQDDTETELLMLFEALDMAAIEDKKLQQEVARSEEEKNQKIVELEAAKKDLEESLSAVKSERSQSAAKIGPEIIEKYEFIKEQRHGIAIAEVKEDKTGKMSCGGCNIGLIPQKTVDLKKPDILVFCDNCQRIMYLKKTVYG